MEIRQLRTLMSIVKLGSFSEAARQLGYTQSSVTSHIQLLEKELGTALFERLGHALMLTADGERLYSYAERMVRLEDEAHAAMAKRMEPIGSLSLGMPESIAGYHLEKLLTEFAMLYPDIQLRVRVGSGRDFLGLLRKNLLDMSFCLEEKIADKDLVAHQLWQEPIVMVAAPDYPLSTLKVVKAKALAGASLIVTDSDSCYQSVLEQELEKKKIALARVLEIGQMQAAKQFVSKGLGVAVLPRAAVQKELKNGSLQILEWQGKAWNINAYIVHHKEKWLSAPMRLFLKLLHERIVLARGKGLQ